MRFSSYLAVLILSIGCQNQLSRDRENRISDHLDVRNAHSMAYDVNRERIVLFGGAGSAKVHKNTWEWVNNDWILVNDEGPGPRTFAAMAYDYNSKSIILFGGNRVLFGTGEEENTFLSDMWSWNGMEWSEISHSGPSERVEASMVYDRSRNRLILFGGYNKIDGNFNLLSDTWEWDGIKWMLVSESGPTPQNGAAMSFDEKRNITVLFGQNADRSIGETWEWNGRDWNQIVTANSERRYNSVMFYDASSQKLIRFGGWSGEKRENDTLEYDGIAWRRISGESPSARNHSRMVYDLKNNRGFMFGGHDGEYIFGDVWSFSNQNWKLLREIEPIPRVANNH